jgi:ABC-type sugar transport system permease subunit
MNARERRNLPLQLLILPALILTGAYLYYPIINTAYLSLFNIQNFNLDGRVFVGFGNYLKLLDDPRFWLSFRNTAYLTAATIFLQLPLAFFLADGLANHIRKKHPQLEVLLLLGLFFPIVIPTPVLAKTWSLFFSGTEGVGYGPFEFVVAHLGLTNGLKHILGTNTLLLLGELNTAIWVVIGVQTWARIGFSLLIYRSAIMGISAEIYESAELDGAGPWSKLFQITIPLIKNVISLTIILAILGIFQLFDMVWLITFGGQPMNSTHVLATYMYTRMFVDLRTGYGAAIAIAILIFSLTLSLIQRRFFREKN